MPRPPAAAALASCITASAAVSGCADGRTVGVAPPGESYDRAFAVVTDLERTPLRVAGRFTVEDGVVAGEGPLYFDLDLDAERFVVVGLRYDDLAARFAGFQRDRLEDLDLAVRTPPAEPAPHAGRDDVLDTALFDFATLLELEDGTEPPTLRVLDPDVNVLDALTLSLPFDVEYCRTDERLTLVGSPEGAFTGDAAGGFVERVHRLDDERFLILTRSNLYLVRRTDPAGTPAVSVPLIQNETRAARARTMAVHRADATRTVVLVAGDQQICDDESCEQGRIWRVELDGDALVSVETSTRTPERRIHGVAIDGPTGRVLAVGQRGLAIVADVDTLDFTEARWGDIPLANGVPIDLDRVTTTGDPDAPHFVAGTNHVFVGDLTRGTLRAHAVPREADNEIAFVSVAVDGDAYWAVARRESVVFRGGATGDFEALDLTVPPSLAVCADAALGAPIGIRQVALDGDRALFVAACTALVVLEPDGCRTALPSGESAIAPSADALSAVAVDDAWITVAGANGTLWELPRR